MSDTRFDDSEAYFAAIAEGYDRLQPVVAGPGYQAGLDFVLTLVPHESEDAFTCVELGCGTAGLTRAVLERFPRAHAVAIDSEPAMLRVARSKLSAYGDRAEVRADNILTCELPPCALVLSSFVFHHIPPEHLGEVLRRIARALAPGGCFILLDTLQVGPRWAERIGEQSRRRYARHLATAIAEGNVTQEEVDARWEYKRRMKEDGNDVEYSHRAEDIMEAMRAAGFGEAGLVWRIFASTILMGFVPPEGGPVAPARQ